MIPTCQRRKRRAGSAYLVHDTDNETLLLNLVGLDGLLILQNLACRGVSGCDAKQVIPGRSFMLSYRRGSASAAGGPIPSRRRSCL